MKAFLEKLGYRLLLESTSIESTMFPCKTALLKANVKASSALKGPVTKNSVLPVTTLIF